MFDLETHRIVAAHRHEELVAAAETARDLRTAPQFRQKLASALRTVADRLDGRALQEVTA